MESTPGQRQHQQSVQTRLFYRENSQLYGSTAGAEIATRNQHHNIIPALKSSSIVGSGKSELRDESHRSIGFAVLCGPACGSRIVVVGGPLIGLIAGMALTVASGPVSKSSDMCSKGYYILWTLFFLQFFTCVSCLFEDQIGKFDWRQRYIGKIRFAAFDAVSGTRKILVATEQNVLAALHPKSGNILWQQVLEKDESVQHMHVGKELVSVSGGPRVHVRAWDKTNGLLAWEWSLSQQQSARARWAVDKGRLYHVVPLDGQLEVSAFSLESGFDLGSRRLAAPWTAGGAYDCVLVGATVVCVTQHSFYWTSLADGGAFAEVPLASFDLTPAAVPVLSGVGELAFSLRLPGKQTVFLMGDKGPRAIHEASATASLLATPFDSNIMFKLENKPDSSALQVSAVSLNTGVEVDEYSSTLILGSKFSPCTLTAAICIKDECAAVLSGDDHTISFVNIPGQITWTREEALASIISTEIIDLPVSDLDAAIESEFGSKQAGIVGMVMRRLTSQVMQIKVLAQTVLGLVQPASSSGPSRASLIRDTFGLHKMIVAVTSAGKAFGIDNLRGELIWQIQLPRFAPLHVGKSPVVPLYVLRTTSHVPFTPLCAILGKDRLTGEGLAVAFEPIKGLVLSSDALGYKVQQVMQLPHPDDEFLRGLVVLDDQLKVHAYPPESKANAIKQAASLYMFTTWPAKGTFAGFSFAHSTKQDLVATKVWELQLPDGPDREVVAVVGKNPTERVNSQGRVLADRSVMYKYINPNLIAIISQVSDSSHKYILNMYLVDGVSGAVVHSATHKRARAPVNVVHSENWLVYSYFNEKMRRTELASFELYEGKSRSNTTAFSSKSNSVRPLVEQQAYIFPSTVDTMKETITEKGITSKHLIMALPNGNILELPWMFVDPRRPTVQTGEMRDEGVIPYTPELPIPPDAIINYNQTVNRVRGIHTAPSGLESTCLVLVYGLDLFYIRVAPSKAFDLLKDDFDHFLIAAVLLGLVIASYVTKKLAARKARNQAWK
ncbi:Hypothetical predicted protein [Cloeon dipterum]|uniref:ER membrane protein complex subunit 1 n=1 Tax=Cloeon dipterum TaxID=197152 RepID=A0A8S1DE82_9INSE|nr:Hypothetical predicted protein [Cloeon dipterum]